MLLYTLTTDGFAREDGSVYYANHLLVDAPDSARDQVEAALRSVLGAPRPAPVPPHQPQCR